MLVSNIPYILSKVSCKCKTKILTQIKSNKEFLFYARKKTQRTDLKLTIDKFNFKNGLFFIKMRSATLIEWFQKSIKYFSETHSSEKTVEYLNAQQKYGTSMVYSLSYCRLSYI